MTMDFSDLDLPDELSHLVACAVPLSSLTTIRVGGPAAMVCRLTTPAIAQQFHALAKKIGVPYYILGAGSNILAHDRGYPGMIFHPVLDSFAIDGNLVTAGAGLDFDLLIAKTLSCGLVGLEFASGIPGSLGGAVMGNAGCYGHEIGEFVTRALVLTPQGRLETVGPEAFDFQYRTTRLRETGSILLNVTLRLALGETSAALKTRSQHLADRKAKHPVNIPCAGSWFRNLPPENPGEHRRAAGKYLEMAGALTMIQGDARVFPRHANIIINSGAATSDDITQLASRMAAAVKEKFGLKLVEEVRRLPSVL